MIKNEYGSYVQLLPPLGREYHGILRIFISSDDTSRAINLTREQAIELLQTLKESLVERRNGARGRRRTDR